MKGKDRRSLNRTLVAERSKNVTKETETCRENDIKMCLKGMWYCVITAKNIVTGDPFMIR